MAGTITYNTTLTNVTYIYRATGGGVSFSANLTATTAFDYFTDTAVVNDCLYINSRTDIVFNVGTAMAGTGLTLVWEYYGGAGTASWTPIENIQDDTNSFTTTGSNRVKFPMQFTHKVVTVNGTSTTWVRCRISAKTTITEGGANATDIVTRGDAYVNIDGYDDGTPCTWTDVYNYMNTNHAYVGCVKNGNYFDFRRVIPRVNSRLLSTNETIELGSDVYGGGASFAASAGISLAYLTNGVVNSADPTRGKFGCTYIMNGVINQYPFQWGDNHYSYDTQYLNPTPYGIAYGAIGYPTLRGTFIDCKLMMVPVPPVSGCVIKNTRFNMYSGFIASSFAGSADFIGNTLCLLTTGGLFGLYQGSFDLRDVDYVFNGSTGSRVCFFQQTASNGLTWNFINPKTRFPGNDSSGNLSMYRVDGSASAPTNVLFYDDSAGTYTDYSTEAASATTGDVPVGGDVGDMLYFSQAVTTANYHPYITSTIGGTNDYVYKWEYYYSGSWREVTGGQWDTTANLTQTGMWYLQRNFSNLSLVTVNGINTYWYRMTIVTKGTGSPMIDKFQVKAAYGTCDWKMNEKYDIQFKAVDAASAVVEGVEVSMTDNFDTVQFTGTSGVDGTITTAEVYDRQWYFDPLDATRNTTTNVVEKVFSPYITKVRKYGYVPQQFNTTVNSIQYMTTGLTTNPYVTAAVTDVDDYTGITIDGAANTITVDEDHTIEEVYDYCQYWAALTASMPYNVPLSTSDGINFTSTYDLIISADITGSGTISIGTGTLTLTGTSTLDITDSTGTYTNIKLIGLEAGSRVQLYDDTNDTELYNDIVAGTTLAFPYVWTEDLDIRVRVMWVDTVTAKNWYEATGTFTVTGMSLNIAQTDDTVYNAIGIDGSTVTECTIVGTTLVVEVDDPDNTTTGQRIYAFEIAWLFTEDGIRDQSLYIDATDMTHFTLLGGLKIKNMDTSNPLTITGANIVPESGAATDVFDLSNGASIALNFNRVEGFSYSSGSGLSPEEHNALLAQKATIDTNLDSKVSQALKTATFIALK